MPPAIQVVSLVEEAILITLAYEMKVEGLATVKKIRLVFALIVVTSIFGVFNSPAFAGAPSGCTNLDVFPQQPAVDFESQIEPIFSACSGCHGIGGAAGLDLRAGEAYENLVRVESTTNPSQFRVLPFEPADSLLLNAINCSVTGGPAFQMPGTDPAQRALIRDWIAQGALARPAPRSVPVLHPFGTGVLVVLMVMVLLVSRTTLNTSERSV